MTAFNKNNLEKIAQFNPVVPENGKFTSKPIFIFKFNQLPTAYQFTLNIVLFGLTITQKYSLEFKVFDNNNTMVNNDEIGISNEIISYTAGTEFQPGIGSTGFNMKLSPITVTETCGRTFRVELYLKDTSGKVLDQAHTFFYTVIDNS